jgi:hypothetical protein
MKSKTLKFIVAASVLLAVPAMADEARVTAYTAKLGGKRVTELANETAKLVTAEKADTRVAAAADAVTAAVSIHAPSAPIVVASVAKAAPETAATAAATAVKLQPSAAGRISKAAVSAAPSQVEAVSSRSHCWRRMQSPAWFILCDWRFLCRSGAESQR